ncbi:MAG: hypothetical protein E7353_06905 [Clostridiales bacterium]|nr:hypothetical protein [Clostridiales bacterium]
MVVYIEYLIIDNFFLTYFICELTYFISRRKKNRKRMIITSTLATIGAFIYPFCASNFVLAYTLKAVAWIILCLILFVKKQSFFSSSLIFLLNTMLVGGVLTFISTLSSQQVDVIGGQVNFSFPIGVIVVAGYVITFVVKCVYTVIFRNRGSEDLVRTVKVGINGTTLHLKGFMDTGNRLVDCKSGLPVVIVKASAIIRAFSPATFASLIEKGRGDCISYTTVTGGVNKIMLIYPDFFTMEGKKENIDVAIGVSFSGFYGDYDVILHPSFN